MTKKKSELVGGRDRFDETTAEEPIAVPEERPAERELSAVEHLEAAIGKLESSRSAVHGEAYRYIAERLRFYTEKLKDKGAI